MTLASDLNRQRLAHNFSAHGCYRGRPAVGAEDVGRAPGGRGLVVLSDALHLEADLPCPRCGCQRVVCWGTHRGCRRCGAVR